VHDVFIPLKREWEQRRPATLEEARRIAAKCASRVNEKWNRTLTEEDSPGNYIIRETPTGFEFVWFLSSGEEERISYDRAD